MDDAGDESASGDSYFHDVMRAINEWRAKPPSVVSVALGYAALPVTWLAQTVVPTSAIEGLLTGLDWVAKNSTTSRKQPDFENLRECDASADFGINIHVAAAAVEGGAAGFFGIISLPADIPAVIALALRTIRQVGAEYGYTANTEDERLFVLAVLRASGANSQAEKTEALLALRLVLVALQRQTWKAMATKAATQALSLEGAIIAVRSVAKQLGINLTKRKALAAVPGIGAFVGASVNGWYIRDVGIAAQRLYQERWLRDRGLLVDGDDDASGD